MFHPLADDHHPWSHSQIYITYTADWGCYTSLIESLKLEEIYTLHYESSITTRNTSTSTTGWLLGNRRNMFVLFRAVRYWFHFIVATYYYPYNSIRIKSKLYWISVPLRYWPINYSPARLKIFIPTCHIIWWYFVIFRVVIKIRGICRWFNLKNKMGKIWMEPV